MHQRDLKHQRPHPWSNGRPDVEPSPFLLVLPLVSILGGIVGLLYYFKLFGFN